MATIFAQAPPQQPAQAQFQPQQQQQQQQAPDPLFEALARYITAGPGPSAVSAAQIQKIIDDHSDNRGYLESIVLPQNGDDLRIWKEHGMATGFVSSNYDSLTLHLTVTKPGNRTGFVLNFHGKAEGFFPAQVYMFDNCIFHWDDLHNTIPASFTLRKVPGSFDNSYSILFRYEMEVPENKPIAEITLGTTTLNLPDRDITGRGPIDVAE